MKNFIKIIKRFLVVCLIPTTMLTGCNIFGLDVQESFKYDNEAGVKSNELNCTVWEFLTERRADFRILMEGIEYVGMENMYNESDATYILLRNNCFTNTSINSSNGGPGFFTRNRLTNNDGIVYTPTTLRDYPKEQVRQLLLYHIVKGAWTWSNLPAGPTWYPTYAEGETAFMNLYLSKTSPPNIRFNDFVGHYVTGSQAIARTTNLKAISGAYIHVIENKYMEQPTLEVLSLK